jgi:hypothetical protein
MTGVAGNVYTLSFAKQSAKGAAALISTGYKCKITGGTLEPQRQLLTLQETDASRQQGETVVVGARVEGTPEWYVRPEEFGLFAYAALGTHSVVGTASPYLHTFTIAQRPPYLTAWKNIGGGTVIDKYTDCTLGTLELSGGAGQALMAKSDIMGLSAQFGAADNTQPIVTGHVFTYPECVVTIGGSAPATVEQWTVTLNNNAEFIQGDGSVGPYDVVFGRAEVSGSFTYLFQSDADYRRFHTGSDVGTAFTTTLFEEALDIGMTSGTDVVHAIMSGITLTAYPVPPDTSGKPIRVAATFTSLPQAAISDYLSLTVANSIATY